MVKIESYIRVISALTALTAILYSSLSLGILTFFIAILLLTLSILNDKHNFYHPPRLLLNIISISAVIFLILNANMSTIVTNSLYVTFILLIIKFYEKKRTRDYLQITLLSIFILAGSALLDTSMKFLIFALILLSLIITQILLITFYEEKEDILIDKNEFTKIMYISTSILIISIPIAVFLFFTLPRTSVPLFDSLNRNSTARTGFSSEVKLGGVSSIQQDNGAAFRATMKEISQNSLYWRGVVLDRYSNGAWSATNKRFKNSSLYVKGDIVDYEIILEPNGEKYLFTLDKPNIVSGITYETNSTLEIIYPEGIHKKIRYKGRSIIGSKMSDNNVSADNYLQISTNDETISQIAKSLSGDTPVQTSENIIKLFNSGEYKYSLSDLPITVNPMRDFFTKYKTGNCEYFASAMALLLRYNNIPSRLIAGYKGGDYNKRFGYYIVPFKNAHVWVEAYIDGAWLRYDPTPGAAIALNNSENKNVTFSQNVRYNLDAVNYYWNILIINYNFEKQLKAAETAREVIAHISYKSTLRYTASVIIIVSAFYLLVIVLKKLFSSKNEADIMTDNFIKVLRSHGIERKLGETLFDVANNISDAKLKKTSLDFVTAFYKYYYRDIPIRGNVKKYLDTKLKNIVSSYKEIHR